MPYIDAVIFGKYVKDADGNNVPNAISDIYAWAIANDEFLPEGESGKGPFGRYEDITGRTNVHQAILDDLAVFVAKLQITTATAAHFASDPRIWTLGYKRFNDEGEQTFSNWGDPLPTEERQQAGNYVSNNSKITKEQLAARFDPEDTRRVVAEKLKEFFRE